MDLWFCSVAEVRPAVDPDQLNLKCAEVLAPTSAHKAFDPGIVALHPVQLSSESAIDHQPTLLRGLRAVNANLNNRFPSSGPSIQLIPPNFCSRNQKGFHSKSNFPTFISSCSPTGALSAISGQRTRPPPSPRPSLDWPLRTRPLRQRRI